ncbi:adhesion G-protein coupled receptor G2-like [Odontesthes bonariensis]|uniref:adhesion G-protein coupled receptor G2-like n=1 Tax=Odontesthes bonariensis TaxID=219752 RepID=UPI003F583B9B
MARLSWRNQLVLVVFLWICSIYILSAKPSRQDSKIKNCFDNDTKTYIVADNFYGIVKASNFCENAGHSCMIFLNSNITKHKILWKRWPQLDNDGLLYLPKSVANKDMFLYVLRNNCSKFCPDRDTSPIPSSSFGDGGNTSSCHIGNVSTKTACKKSKYDETYCSKEDQPYNDKYIINVTKKEMECVNCDSPLKIPDEKIKMNNTPQIVDGKVPASEAANLMKNMENLVATMKGTSASLSVAEGVTGILVKGPEPEEMEGVSFAYQSPADSIKIIDDNTLLDAFSRTISVSKEAFEKAVASNISASFAAVLRFTNMTQDDNNSTLLGDEVVAVEMGADIKNLTDTVNLTFKNTKYDRQIPHCNSWNGEGNKPNWTEEGCETFEKDNAITCRCSHLTFFAILMTPINETISSSDLNILTIITQVGCGLSIFFLGIILFLHFFSRKTKASETTTIFICLVSSMLLMNLTFLINNYVAAMKNSLGCKIMAAVMHYFMLATFSWFAAQGFHLCLQMYKGGQVVIKRYILKVSAASWVLPSVVVILLLIFGKYGELTIYTDNPKYSVAMCWITDNDIHYIVNIGYYALVFLFTFSTAIIVLSWLFNLKKIKKDNTQESENGKSVTVIMGLCFMLGITWGFAFFAYGVLRIPATYIFTILNSFQGFFLFIYYNHTSNLGLKKANVSSNNSSQSSTSTSTCSLKTRLDNVSNPYMK